MSDYRLKRDTVDEVLALRTENEQLRALNAELLTALVAMLQTHGKPRREEWISDAGFEHAMAVDAQVRAAIAKAKGKK